MIDLDKELTEIELKCKYADMVLPEQKLIDKLFNTENDTLDKLPYILSKFNVANTAEKESSFDNTFQYNNELMSLICKKLNKYNENIDLYVQLASCNLCIAHTDEGYNTEKERLEKLYQIEQYSLVTNKPFDTSNDVLWYLNYKVKLAVLKFLSVQDFSQNDTYKKVITLLNYLNQEKNKVRYIELQNKYKY